jgi:glycosyltransferase involved in cell wall biosynthesis
MIEKGLAPGKFIHVPNGIAVDDLEPLVPASPEGVAAKRQIEAWQSAGMKVVIHPGSQGLPNGLDLLVDAARPLSETPIGIMLVGSGTETDRLKDKAKDLPKVAFFGRVPKAEALWLTAAADIGYAGGVNRPIYRFGTSFNKVADFLRFEKPIVETIPTGAGIVAADASPASIAQAILHAAEHGALPAAELVRAKLDYRKIAKRYAEALER